MDTYLERYTLTQEEIETLRRLVTSIHIDLVIKKLPTKKSPGTRDFTGELYQSFREELALILSQTLPKNRRGWNTSSQ